MNQELLTTKDVAARLGVAKKTVRGWVRDGRVPAYRLSPNQLRFDWAEVLEALKTERVMSSAGEDALAGDAHDGGPA